MKVISLMQVNASTISFDWTENDFVIVARTAIVIASISSFPLRHPDWKKMHSLPERLVSRHNGAQLRGTLYPSNSKR